ncbi:MAG: hypothetical protein ACREO4_14745 [Lysobacter sp.]
MNTRSPFPDQLNWTSQDLADAVPLRLSELFAFDASLADIVAGDSANATVATRTQPDSYLPTPPASTGFRIR